MTMAGIGFTRRSEPSILYAAVCALLVAAITLVLAGCSGQPASTPSEIIKKAMYAQDQLKSVNMRLDNEIDFKIPGGQRSVTVSYQGVYEKPDRWHLKVVSSGARSEVIILGSQAFVKLPGSDTWTEKQSKAVESSTPAGIVNSKYLQSATNVQLMDKKGDAYHLKFDLDLGKFVKSFSVSGIDPSVFKGKKARMDVWVQRETYRIEKATMSFAGDLSALATPGTLIMNMEVDFTDFNEPVSIEAPTLSGQ